MGEAIGCGSFCCTEGREFKASLLVGERFGERFSKSRPKVRINWGYSNPNCYSFKFPHP